jgi:hypothetical protein
VLDRSRLRLRLLRLPRGSGFSHLSAWLEKLDRLPRHHCRNRMLVHELRMRVPPQQNAKIVEPSNNPLQLDAINEKDGHRRVVFWQRFAIFPESWVFPHSLLGTEPSQFMSKRSDEAAEML